MNLRRPRPGDMEPWGERRLSDRAIYVRLLRLARPYWPHIGALTLVGFLSTPIALLTPLPLKIVIDSALGDRPLPGFVNALTPAVSGDPRIVALAAAVGLVVAIAALSQLHTLASSYLYTYTGERLVLRFRSRLFEHLQRLSLSYHDTRGGYDSIHRVLYDAPAIQWIAIQGVIPFVTAAMTLIAMLWVTARIDASLALVALCISPLLLAATFRGRRRLRQQWRHAKELESSAVSVVQEVLGAVRVVKAFGQESRELGRFVSRADEGVRARTRAHVAEGVYGLLIGMMIAVGTAVALYIGTRHVLAGTLTLGNLILVMGYIGQLYAPLKSIGSNVMTIQNSMAGAERAFDLLDEAPDVVERPDARPLEAAQGAVAFDGVGFAYDGGPATLHDVSFDIAPGARIGIMGPTGAGKTTLVSLLVRFYDPTEGRILLDGVDIRDYRLTDLRAQFEIMLQEPVLFSTSIAENIAYARPDATMDDIVAAARAANAHDFIVAQADGYETRVGERGMKLSGGERQRISLARAFLKDAPILVLDEPTSSVDLETERLIMDAMERLMRGRTTVMIAHRLSTLENCDAILRLDRGRLVEHTRAVADVLDAARAAGRRPAGAASGPG